MKKPVVDLLKKVLKEKNIELKEEEIENLIETPPSVEMGDYAFPCYFLSRELKQSPNKIALELRSKIGTPPSDFQDIQTAGPYINFFLDRKKFAALLLKEVLSKKNNFGKKDIGKGKKAVVEHTSINPNAPPHVGRVRNAIIGDSIVQMLKFFNYKPEVHYYVNDVSKQIAMLVLAGAEKMSFDGMLKKYIEICRKVSKSKKLEKQVFEILEKFENKDKDITKKFKKITKTCVEGQKKILLEMGINYDFFDYESSFLNEGKDLLSNLKKSGKLQTDSDGRIVLDLKDTAVEKQMKVPVLVLTRSNRTGLYPLRDISYTLYKMKISNNNIIVLGEDQKLYFQQIKEALKLIGAPPPEVVHYSYILISEKGKSRKMSTRKGEVVMLKDFLKSAVKKAEKEISKRKTKGDPKKVGVSAVKYAILKNGNNKIINFNLDEALNFEGDTGPYLLYSYARASSIIRKAKNKDKNIKIKKLDEKEYELVKKISRFPTVIYSAYKTLNPSLIANYSFQLAQIFNEFYHSCPVINSEQEKFRILLVEAFRIVLKNSLNFLGIETLDEM
ncbi:MAG: arginine--tRNA ligase [archaeon]